MKKIKKNQLVVTALAVMIAVAGYINYSGNLREKLEQQNEVIEQDVTEPGTAVLTSGNVATTNAIAQVKLNREQVRAKNKEALFDIVNATLSESAKKDAIAQINRLADISEREMAAEILLEAKGFENTVVSINVDSVDVVVPRDSLTDVERTQIEDIVKRKSNMPANKITINVCNN